MALNFRDNPALQGVLQQLEADRKVLRVVVIKSIAIAIAGALCIAITVFNGALSPWGYILGGLILILAMVQAAKRAAAFKAYTEAFKMKVIGAALQELDPSLIIEPEKGLSEQEFVSAQLFNEDPDRYSSEDQVSGMAGKTGFCFSEVHAEYKTESTNKDGKKETSWHDIFKGIIFTADFNKNFKGVTKLRPKNIGNKIGAWFSKAAPIFASKKNQLVELENIAFSNLFVTHSTDQIEARYILTPAMMDKLCLLNEKCSDTVSLTFIKSRVYIVFPMRENFFEPPIFKSLLEPECLEKDFHIIQFMYDIIAELDLNTRIWGKE
jgi:hypothetical protein